MKRQLKEHAYCCIHEARSTEDLQAEVCTKTSCTPFEEGREDRNRMLKLYIKHSELAFPNIDHSHYHIFRSIIFSISVPLGQPLRAAFDSHSKCNSRLSPCFWLRPWLFLFKVIIIAWSTWIWYFLTSSRHRQYSECSKSGQEVHHYGWIP